MRRSWKGGVFRCALACVLSGCSSGGGGEPSGTSAAETPPVAAASSGPAVASPVFRYGQEYPAGKAAVDYLLSDAGTWKNVTSVEYVWNYYPYCASADKPLDRNKLIEAADGTRFFTAPDADCNLLFDADQDGSVDARAQGYAFHEHNGRGTAGKPMGTAFTNFWYDDNVLARYLTDAYGRPAPAGLANNTNHSRWQILGGNASQWVPYNDDHLDRLALDGMYYLAVGDPSSAMRTWERLRDLSGTMMDPQLRRYTYPNVQENYHLGLFCILTTFLRGSISDPNLRRELLQHEVSLRSNILSNQEHDDSGPIGWRSSIVDAQSLINTETVAVDVLALGAAAVEAFEAGALPNNADDSGFVSQPAHVLSAAVAGASSGYMLKGLRRAYAPGSYVAEFVLRSPGPALDVGIVEVVDLTTNQIVARSELTAQTLSFDSQWTAVELPFVAAAAHEYDFRLYWKGGADLDLASARIRPR